MIQAVVYDIDNTLTNDVSWLKVTELLGASVTRHQDIFDRFLKHELPYSEAKRQLIELWQSTGKANKRHWQMLFDAWPLADGAAELVQYTHDQGYQTALITGSLDLFAAAIAKKLHVPHYYANTELLWDESGYLIDFNYVRDQAAQKLTHLKEFIDRAGIPIENCVAIGDGDNDIEIFKATGRGIALGSGNPSLLAVSWLRSDDLFSVVPLLAANR